MQIENNCNSKIFKMRINMHNLKYKGTKRQNWLKPIRIWRVSIKWGRLISWFYRTPVDWGFIWTTWWGGWAVFTIFTSSLGTWMSFLICSLIRWSSCARFWPGSSVKGHGTFWSFWGLQGIRGANLRLLMHRFFRWKWREVGIWAWQWVRRREFLWSWWRNPKFRWLFTFRTWIRRLCLPWWRC